MPPASSRANLVKPNYKTNSPASITIEEDQSHQVRLLLAFSLPFHWCINNKIKRKKSSGPIWNSFLRWLAEGGEHYIWLVVTKEKLESGIRNGKNLLWDISPSSLRLHKMIPYIVCGLKNIYTTGFKNNTYYKLWTSFLIHIPMPCI